MAIPLIRFFRNKIGGCRMIKKIALFIICLFLLSSFALAANFGVGDPVVVQNVASLGLNVRDQPSTSGTALFKKFDGNQGSVLSGPTAANGYTWWKIRWSDGQEGYSADGDVTGAWLTKWFVSPSTKFSLGNTVQVSGTGGSNLNIRGSPPLLAFLGSAGPNAQGTVVSGPFYGIPQGSSGFYQFWQVNFGSVNGWAAEDFLTKIQTATVPSAPQSLSASVGDQYVSLSWSAPSNNGGAAITSYKVYRSTSPGQETFYSTVTSTSFFEMSVLNGVTYYYKVSAVNSVGESSLSNEVSATPYSIPTTTVPSAPTNLVASGGTNSATLSWNAPSSNGGASITSYRVYRGTSSGGESLLATASSNSYNDGSVSPGTTYYYKVSAVNSVGESSLSGEAQITISGGGGGTTVPSAPIGLVATGGTSQIDLSWNAPSNDGGSAVQHYEIYRGTSSGGETLYFTTTSAGTTFQNSGNVVSGTTYYYKVKAVNVIGASGFSNEASASLQSTPPSNGAYNTAFLNDVQLEDHSSMTAAQIRTFLQDHNSYFKQTVADVDAVNFDAADVIYQAAQDYQINPKVILATLQKEHQGVTGTSRPSDTGMKFLMGCISQTTAREQLRCAAERFRSYQNSLINNGVTIAGWKPGTAKLTQDGVSVTPATNAVAGQFTYTPYAGTQWGGNNPAWGGVYLFYYWWGQFGFDNVVPPSGDTDYPGAEWIPTNSGRWSVGDRGASEITHIVIHTSEQTRQETINLFKSAGDTSAHYLIDKQGNIIQFVREKNIANHAGNYAYNQHSIGIEHEAEHDDKGLMNENKMMEASNKLVHYLIVKYNIPADRVHILGHNEVPCPCTENCPGALAVEESAPGSRAELCADGPFLGFGGRHNHKGAAPIDHTYCVYGGAKSHVDPGPYWNWDRYGFLILKKELRFSSGSVNIKAIAHYFPLDSTNYMVYRVELQASGFIGSTDLALYRATQKVWPKKIYVSGSKFDAYLEHPLVLGKDDLFGLEISGWDESQFGIFTYLLQTPIKVKATVALDPQASQSNLAGNLPVYLVKVFSPVELRVYDEEGRVTGLVNGEVKTEIPDSLYDIEKELVLSSTKPARYELVGTENGVFGIVSVSSTEDPVLTAQNIPVNTSEVITFEPSGGNVVVTVDQQGDGTVDATFNTTSNMTAEEFVQEVRRATCKVTFRTSSYDGHYGKDDWIAVDVNADGDLEGFEFQNKNAAHDFCTTKKSHFIGKALEGYSIWKHKEDSDEEDSDEEDSGDSISVCNPADEKNRMLFHKKESTHAVTDTTLVDGYETREVVLCSDVSHSSNSTEKNDSDTDEHDSDTHGQKNDSDETEHESDTYEQKNDSEHRLKNWMLEIDDSSDSTEQNHSILLNPNDLAKEKLNGKRHVKIKSDDKLIVEFPFDFSLNEINTSNVSIELRSVGKGGASVKGIHLGDERKTLRFPQLIDSNQICILDAEASLDEITSDCAGEHEYLIPCDGSVSEQGYRCDLVDKTFIVYGLRHSAVSEWSGASTSSASASTPASSAGYGGGGSAGNPGEPFRGIVRRTVDEKKTAQEVKPLQNLAPKTLPQQKTVQEETVLPPEIESASEQSEPALSPAPVALPKKTVTTQHSSWLKWALLPIAFVLIGSLILVRKRNPINP